MGDLEDLAEAARQQSPRYTIPQSVPPQYGPQYPTVPTPAGMERCWHVHDRGHQFGPHTEAELATLVAVGTLSTSAMVWRTGSPRWAPISAVVPMPAYLPPQPVGHQSPPDPLQYTQAGSTNRVLIGIMGIVFGWAGVHKFMLGYTQAGVIMAVIGVVGFFCYGIGWLVMGVIGAIEGIIYLTKGDQQFYNEYVLRKKEWF